MLYNSSDPVLQAQAEAEYKAALMLGPTNEKAESRLGDIAAKKRDLKEAKTDYFRALQLDLNDGDTDIDLAKVLLLMNETQAAQKLLEKPYRSIPQIMWHTIASARCIAGRA